MLIYLYFLGGLLDVLLPALYHGAPVLAYKFPQKFDPKKVQELCRIHKVKHVFLPPTALKMMKQVREERERGAQQEREAKEE